MTAAGKKTSKLRTIVTMYHWNLPGMCTILTPFIFTENGGCHSKGSGEHIQKSHQKMPEIYKNLDFNLT